ncbi:hypothetical protein Ade02nite_02070 [Paractinoplanes deccanensis]|uniref:Uncharacterized protein n=1 Tax=Paractinoplanes deccanensis TaxID=113561 RepID=A0ABQ3XUZ1_9ACTN|nr:hypothetical protein Ade02nite_02070 [Actinoplanes deccanensis]
MAWFLVDLGAETVETVANVDVFVDVPDGSSWALTMACADEVRRAAVRRGRDGGPG